jgi:cytochrome c biogenesis protein CcmG/thiol:disulfide interchange protein DsbE
MQAHTHNLLRRGVLGAIVIAGGLIGFVATSDDSSSTQVAAGAPATTSEVAQESALPPPANPAPLSDVEYTTFDGETGTIADHRGKPVVVNFWASWCPACIAEMPEFEEIHQEFKDRVVFLGFDERDDRDDAIRLASETGVTYTLVDDPDGAFFVAYDGIAMPTTAFITPSGELSERFSGLLDADSLRDRLLDLLGEDA